MNLLVTGGYGFIGFNLIRHLLNDQAKYSVVNYDLSTFKKKESIFGFDHDSSRYYFEAGDIRNKERVRELFQNYSIEGVIHCAAQSHVDRSIENPGEFVSTNVDGTRVLLEVSRDFGVKKFLFVSTDEVYGEVKGQRSCREDAPFAPSSPYAATKAGAELLVRSFEKTFGLPVMITRSSNNYGPYQHPEKFIPRMIIRALKEKPLPIYGDGTNVRDWIYVKDQVQALLNVFEKGTIGEIYNIGADQEFENIEVAHRILDMLDKSHELIKYVEDRPGHDRRYSLNCEKIINDIGWRPQWSFSEGLAKTVQWYQDNKSWWTRLTEQANQETHSPGT